MDFYAAAGAAAYLRRIENEVIHPHKNPTDARAASSAGLSTGASPEAVGGAPRSSRPPALKGAAPESRTPRVPRLPLLAAGVAALLVAQRDRWPAEARRASLLCQSFFEAWAPTIAASSAAGPAEVLGLLVAYPHGGCRGCRGCCG